MQRELKGTGQAFELEPSKTRPCANKRIRTIGLFVAVVKI